MHAETCTPSLFGRYDTVNTYAKNRWHYVEVTAVAGNYYNYRWSNEAGVAWGLTRTNDKSKLALGPDCPYFDTTAHRHVEVLADSASRFISC